MIHSGHGRRNQAARRAGKDGRPRGVEHAEVQPDAACRRPIDFGHRHSQLNLLLARNTEQVDDVAVHVAQEEVFKSLLRQAAARIRNRRDVEIADRNFRCPPSRSRDPPGALAETMRRIWAASTISLASPLTTSLSPSRASFTAVLLGKAQIDFPLEHFVDAVQPFLLLRSRGLLVRDSLRRSDGPLPDL